MFVILQDQRGRLSYAPQSWVKRDEDGNQIIYWPKNNQTILQNDPTSEPVMFGSGKWLIIHEIVKRANIPSKEMAEKEIDEMMQNDDTDENYYNIDTFIRRPKSKGALKGIPQYNVSEIPKALSSAMKNTIIRAASPVTPTTARSPEPTLTTATTISSTSTSPALSLPAPLLPTSLTPKSSLNSVQNLVNAVEDQTMSPLLSASQLQDIGRIFTNQEALEMDLTINNVTATSTSQLDADGESCLYLQSNGDITDRFGNIIQGNSVAGDNSAGNVDAASTSMVLQTIMNNQEVMAKRLITLEKGMQEIFVQVQNVAGMVSSLLSNPSSSTQSTDITNESVGFQKIEDENGLKEFEKTIEDRNVRKKFIDHFISLIGKCNNAPVRSIALQLDQKMFEETFWSQTAWTGGRKVDGPKKFAFSIHIICVAFMNDVIRGVCGTQMTDNAFSEFIKSRTRNAGYIRTTNRQATARAPKKRKIHDKENVPELPNQNQNLPATPNTKTTDPPQSADPPKTIMTEGDNLEKN